MLSWFFVLYFVVGFACGFFVLLFFVRTNIWKRHDHAKIEIEGPDVGLRVRGAVRSSDGSVREVSEGEGVPESEEYVEGPESEGKEYA